MFHYILQVVSFQLLFLVIYDIFHRKDTFFNWNRIYLVLAPLTSLLLPFIKIESLGDVSTKVYTTSIERIITFTSSTESAAAINLSPEKNITDINWWIIIYFLGIGVSLLLFILKIHKLQILKNVSLKSLQSGKKVITLPNSKQAFSFWNTIFLGDALSEEERQHILQHELIHIKEKHSLDQLFFELLKIILWWNPIIYLFQQRITVLHEYIADELAVFNIGKTKYLEQLLNATFQTQEITFVHQFFNQSLIKKRIFMLQKSKSKTFVKFKYLLLVPVLMTILCYTSCDRESKDETTKVSTLSSKSTESTYETFNNFERKCLNPTAKFDFSKNLSFKIENGPASDVIISLISSASGETVRTAYIGKSMRYEMQNLPPDIYYHKAIYGTDYFEENKNGKCYGSFKNIKHQREYKKLFDFSTEPSVSHSADGIKETTKTTYSLRLNYKNKRNKKFQQYNKINEPDCPNKNAKYNRELDNYLKLTNPSTTIENIVELREIESNQIIRTLYLRKGDVYYARNIPEGKYLLVIKYGEGYKEKMSNGKCFADFKNQKMKEIGKDVLDFTMFKTENGYNMPNFSMTINLE